MYERLLLNIYFKTLVLISNLALRLARFSCTGSVIPNDVQVVILVLEILLVRMGEV